MSWYRRLLECQRAAIEAAFASIDGDALAHKHAFGDQVLEFMRIRYGLAPWPDGGGGSDRAQKSSDDGRGTPRSEPADLGTVLIFSARNDCLPRGYWQPGISAYRPFSFSALDQACDYIDERIAADENIYVRAAPASAAGLGVRLVFSEYPAIAMTVFHEALHNRIQVPLAVEEPLHTLLALMLTLDFASSLPAMSEPERRLRSWLIDGSEILRRRYLNRARRYQAFLRQLDPERPDSAAMNRYARTLLAEHRRTLGSAAQHRYGRVHKPPYINPPLTHTLRVLALEPAERGLLGTALLADYSTYERQFVAVYERLAPHWPGARGSRDSTSGRNNTDMKPILTALLDHCVVEAERYAFEPAAEAEALAWLTDTLASL